ncbi:MAG: cation transporter [Planctomycetia bacterium]|nr:cation transporter [Planctomycetia bacterium]
MGHHHDRHQAARSDRAQSRARLAWILVFTLAYMVAEIVGGYLADSLALLADAGHMFSDAAALGLSLFAAWISQRPPTPQHSYGYYRAEILAALANGATLIAIAIFIFVEAFNRLRSPEVVEGRLMFGIAAGGLVVNVVGLLILNAGKAHSLNVHGAWLHLMTDAMGSIAAIAAGALIWSFGWYWADPVASILIGLLVIYSSWNLVKQAIGILMESTPGHLDVDAVRSAMVSAQGVCEVHDLHIWTITSGMESLSAHVVLLAGYEAHASLDSMRKILHDQFGIDHITIQIEPAGQEECHTSF